MNGKYYLFKNLGLLTISQFGTKMLSFFLVPLYTYVLTTEEYGIYDLNTTTVALLLPILTLNISDAALRFPMDKDSDRREIFIISIRYFWLSTIIVSCGIILNVLFKVFNVLNQYPVFFVLLFSLSTLDAILVNFSRGIDRVKDVAISGVLCSAVMITLNIVFLLPLHLGLPGYFMANIIGIAVQCIFLLFSIRFWKYFSAERSLDKKLNKAMVVYSRPLLINNISWWVSSASDRYVVTLLCGVSANGIYSVGYKIPSILNIFQTIFGQAWTISAVKEFDPKDENRFFTSMYNAYNFSMTLICSMLIIFAKIMAHFLYAKDFYEAWKYVPFLLIAIVFGALSGYIGGIFAAVKDTKVFARSSIIGATLNIILNILLVKSMGALGAAISTAVSYIVIWAVRIWEVKKYISLHLNVMRDLVVYSILLIQSLLLFICSDTLVLYSIQIVFLGVILCCFSYEIKSVIEKVKEKMR